MPTLEEVHLGVGSSECTFDFDPDLLEELADFRHLLFYRNNKLLGTAVILSRTPSLEGITVSGYGLGFWLGVDNDGPVIEDREYIAGNNQVFNGDFEILDALGFPLYWKQSESTKWALYTSSPHAGSNAVYTTADMGKDDVLTNTPARDVPVGALVRASCYAKRISGSVGRLRLRTVYEGRYDPTDLLAGKTWTDDSEFPGDTVVGGSSFTLGPLTRPQVVNNSGFESGLTGWIANPDPDPAWGIALDPYEGSQALSHIDATGSTGSLANDTDTSSPSVINAYPVKKGERWLLEIVCKATAGTDGFYDVRVFPNFGAPLSVAGGDGASLADQGYKYSQHEVEIQDEGGGLLITLSVWQQTAGEYLFDRYLATRIKGNTGRTTTTSVSVIPEKSYKLLAPVTADANCTDGAVKFQVLLRGSGRADQIIESGTVDFQAKNRTLLDFSFTPPSGYDTATVTVVPMDIVGGPIVVNEYPSLTLEDTSTYIVDKVITSGASWTHYTQDSVAPAGTEKVHLELIAESLGNGWAVDDVEWHRRETIDTPESIVDDLLRDPDTNDYLVSPGTINALGSSQYDWLLHNIPNRPALLQLLRGGRLDPVREFRHNPDNTLDVGLPEELFEHRSVIFTSYGHPKLLLLSRDDVTSSVEDRLTRVKVIGQSLQQKAPLPDAVITGEATTTIPDAYDWFGNAVSRTRIIEDSSVDFAAYADAVAETELDKSTNGTQSITLGISEWSAWGEFNVGDWLPVYFPEALLVDTSNPMTDEDGRRVYPIEKRCLSRKLDMARGDGFEVRVRRPDGTEYVVPDSLVRWADKTSAQLELGDVRVDFANDPQGPGAGVAMVRRLARNAR